MVILKRRSIMAEYAVVRVQAFPAKPIQEPNRVKTAGRRWLAILCAEILGVLTHLDRIENELPFPA